MSGHIAPIRLYFVIFGALMVFTLLTVWVSYLNLGYFNLPMALIIAITKAMLVILYFMHVRWSDRLVQVTAASGFVFLLILFSITLSDYMTRDIVALGK